ncbi:MAG: hypothetical protein Kow0069_04680 [Promethearchaeota archaeon]
MALIGEKRIKDAIEATKAILTGRDPELIEDLVNHLAEIYEVAPPVLKTLVPELLENFGLADDLVRYSLILSLKDVCETDPNLILPFSHEFISSADGNKREGMLRLLSFIAKDHPNDVEEYAEEVLACLADAEEHVANQAKETLKAIGRSAGDKLRPHLLEALKGAQDDPRLTAVLEEILRSLVQVKDLDEEQLERMALEAKSKELETKERTLEDKEKEITQQEIQDREREIEEKERELKEKERERKRRELERLDEERKRQELERKLRELKEKEELLRLEEIRRKEEELRRKEEEIRLERERLEQEEMDAKLKEKELEVERLEKQVRLEELRRREELLRRQQEIARKRAELELVEQELAMKELEAKQREIMKAEKTRIERELAKLVEEIPENDYELDQRETDEDN